MHWLDSSAWLGQCVPLPAIRAGILWAAIAGHLALAPMPAPAAQAEIQSVIAGLENQLMAAFNTLDAVALEQLWDDEFVVVFPNGAQHNKRQRLAALKDLPAAIPQYTNLSVEIRTLPGVAVAIVRARVQSGDPGRSSAIRLLSTRVWVDRGGRWKILSAHVAQLKD